MLSFVEMLSFKWQACHLKHTQTHLNLDSSGQKESAEDDQQRANQEQKHCQGDCLVWHLRWALLELFCFFEKKKTKTIKIVLLKQTNNLSRKPSVEIDFTWHIIDEMPSSRFVELRKGDRRLTCKSK